MSKRHDHEDCRHSHNHSHAHGRGKRWPWVTATILLAVIVTNIGLGGYQFNMFWSQGEDASSLLADSMHNLSDGGATVLAALGFAAANMVRANLNWTSGAGKVQALTALVNFTALIALMVWAAYEAATRLRNPGEFSGETVLKVGVAALAVNVISVVLLSIIRDESGNMAAAFLHHAVDLASSVGLMCAGYLYSRFGWTHADPAITIAISAIVIVVGARGTWRSLKELLDATPGRIDSSRVIDFLNAEFEGRYHSLMLWGGDSVTRALVHVEADPIQGSRDEIIELVSGKLHQLGVDDPHVIVHSLGTDCPGRSQRFGNIHAQGWEGLAHAGHSH